MPYVKIEVIEGITREQKAGLVADVTQSLVERLGRRPDQVFVVIQEISADDWGYSGRLISDLMAAPGEDANAAVPSR
jgi:4-oxalocrotonate tautomerase